MAQSMKATSGSELRRHDRSILAKFGWHRDIGEHGQGGGTLEQGESGQLVVPRENGGRMETGPEKYFC